MYWVRRHRRGRPPHPDLLTPAEWRILDHVREGSTNAEIAVRTGLSINTVKKHLTSIHAKTGIPDRPGLVHWEGMPAAPPPERRGMFAPLLPFISAATGARLAAAGVATIVVLGALVFAFGYLDDDVESRHVDRDVTPERWSGDFPAIPCGIEIVRGAGHHIHDGAWECFIGALHEGEPAQLLAVLFPYRSSSYQGDGVTRLYTTRSDGGIDVMEALHDDGDVVARHRFECDGFEPANTLSDTQRWAIADVREWLDGLASAVPGEERALANCSSPVADSAWTTSGTDVRHCGVEHDTRQPGARHTEARRCLIDALGRGSPSQFVTIRPSGHGQARAEVYYVTGPGEVQVYAEEHDRGLEGRSIQHCSALASPSGDSDPLDFKTSASDCTPIHRAEGPRLACGIMVTLSSRDYRDGDEWRCFQDAWEQGIPAHVFHISIDANGAGFARHFVTGQGSGEEAGFRFNFSATELDFADGRAMSRNYYPGCSGDEARLEDCFRSVPSEAGRAPDRNWEARRFDDPVLCGVEVLRDSSAYIDVAARECLRDAFDEGAPAQLLTIRFPGGDPVSELLTTHGPGDVHRYRDSWARDGSAGITREVCEGLSRVDAPALFEVSGCHPAA